MKKAIELYLSFPWEPQLCLFSELVLFINKTLLACSALFLVFFFSILTLPESHSDTVPCEYWVQSASCWMSQGRGRGEEEAGRREAGLKYQVGIPPQLIATSSWSSLCELEYFPSRASHPTGPGLQLGQLRKCHPLPLMSETPPQPQH